MNTDKRMDERTNERTNKQMNDREDDGTARETDISIVEECSIAGGSTMNKRKKKTRPPMREISLGRKLWGLEGPQGSGVESIFE